MARTMTKRKGAAKGQIEVDLLPIVRVAAPAPARMKLAPRYDASLLATRRDEPAPTITVGAPPIDDGLPPTRSTYIDERASAEPFGAWLVKQKGRDGLLGQLATAAAADRGLTKAATPDDLRKRLVEQQADGDMHAALDDAEIDWIAL